LPSIPARKKPYYLNPLENLEDLLFNICGVLKKEPVESTNGSTLVVGTLDAHFERTVDGTDITENLRIRKTWKPHMVERIICSLEYTEPKIWEAIRKEEMKENPDKDRFYKDFLAARGKNRYLSYEMFVDSVRCMQWLGCKLYYETSNLGRGLHTLAKLKINPKDLVVEGDATLFQMLYDEMERRADRLLSRELGQERVKWKSALQRRFIDIPLKFTKKFENANPPGLLKDYVVGICKIYANDEPKETVALARQKGNPRASKRAS
jgi:hypothetical protein